METYKKITHDGKDFIEVTNTMIDKHEISVADLEKKKAEIQEMIDAKV